MLSLDHGDKLRWIEPLHFGNHSGRIILRLRHGDSWLEPSNNRVVVFNSPRLQFSRSESQRNPQFCRATVPTFASQWELKAFRHHTDHCVDFPIEQDSSSHDV